MTKSQFVTKLAEQSGLSKKQADTVLTEMVDMIIGAVKKGDAVKIPNLGALNFLLHESLDGGGTLSLKTDAQGKTYSAALLRMEVEVDDKLAQQIER